MSGNIFEQKKENFWIYAQKKLGLKSKTDVLRQSPKIKESLFLRWKHGFANEQANFECEMTDQYSLRNIRQRNVAGYSGEQKSFWELELALDETCQKIRLELGLNKPREPGPEQKEAVAAEGLVQKVMSKFKGTIEEWEE